MEKAMEKIDFEDKMVLLLGLANLIVWAWAGKRIADCFLL